MIHAIGDFWKAVFVKTLLFECKRFTTANEKIVSACNKIINLISRSLEWDAPKNIKFKPALREANFKDMMANKEEAIKKAEVNRENVQNKDNGVVGMTKNLQDINGSCHNSL